MMRARPARPTPSATRQRAVLPGRKAAATAAPSASAPFRPPHGGGFTRGGTATHACKCPAEPERAAAAASQPPCLLAAAAARSSMGGPWPPLCCRRHCRRPATPVAAEQPGGRCGHQAGPALRLMLRWGRAPGAGGGKGWGRDGSAACSGPPTSCWPHAAATTCCHQQVVRGRRPASAGNACSSGWRCGDSTLQHRRAVLRRQHGGAWPSRTGHASLKEHREPQAGAGRAATSVPGVGWTATAATTAGLTPARPLQRAGRPEREGTAQAGERGLPKLHPGNERRGRGGRPLPPCRPLHAAPGRRLLRPPA